MVRILEKYQLGPKIQFALLDAPLIARSAQPGQFLIVTMNEKAERLPLTIADFDRDKGTVSIVFQEMGKSTTELGMLKAGDGLYGVLGPQGTPTEMGTGANCIVIGGGIGIAPVFPIARN